MAAGPPANPAKDGLDSAAQFLRYTLALATGALVFSAGLVKEGLSVPQFSRLFLIGAWALLVLAIVTGLLAFARIPVLLRASTYDIEDSYLVWPWRLHQITFGLGVVLLGVALVTLLLNAPAASRVRTAPDSAGSVTIMSNCPAPPPVHRRRLRYHCVPLAPLDSGNPIH